MRASPGPARISGTISNRLMADCRAGKIDRVLVKSLSRFARNSKDCLEAVRELRSLHVNVYFEKENIDTGHMTSELYFTMHAAFSQEESGSIAKNMRRGAAMRMRNGTFRLSQAPYGYRLDDSGDLLVCPEESRIVAEIFQGYLSGKSVREIAADWRIDRCQNFGASLCGALPASVIFSPMNGTWGTSGFKSVLPRTNSLIEK